MRSFAIILATICAATVGTTSALVEAGQRTVVEVDANGYDGLSCNSNVCIPENTRDGSTSSNSRWACQRDILDSSDEDDGCCITYSFGDIQDIVRVQIAFLNCHVDPRTLDVYENGNYHSTIMSSGLTSAFQNWNLYTDETEEIKICLAEPQSRANVWLDITEVQFVVV